MWNTLASESAATAYEAMGSLVMAPDQAVAFLKERVKPVPHADQKRIDQCLVDLDSKNFKNDFS